MLSHAGWPRIRFTFVALAWMGVSAACWNQTPEATRTLLRNSLTLASLTSLLAVPVAAFLAYLMSRFAVPWSRQVDGAMLVLLFFPLYLQLAAWEAGFGRGGWYSTLIAQRLSEPPLEGLRGAAFVHAVAAIPWLYWIFRLGFETIPHVLEQAASLDATRWQVFSRVTLPLSVPLLLGGISFASIVAMTEITITDRYQFRSYAEVLYNEYALNPTFAGLPLESAAVQLNLMTLVATGLLLCWLLGPRLRASATLTPRTKSPASLATRIAAYVLPGLLLGIPIMNLIYQAGIEVRQVEGLRERAWSFGKCIQLVASSPWTYRRELAWSAILGQLTVVSTLSLATVWAWFGRANPIVRWLGIAIGIISFATPGTLMAFGIIRLMNPPDAGPWLAWIYDHSPVAVWLAMTLKSLPLACVIMYHGMRSLSHTRLDAAKLDGATSSAFALQIVLPQLRSHLLVASFVCLATSLGELSASLLLLPLDGTTVSSRIFSLIHYGAEDQLAGLCLSCVFLMTCLALATSYVLGVRVKS